MVSFTLLLRLLARRQAQLFSSIMSLFNKEAVEC